MKPAAYILLLVIYYVCISASQGQTRVRPTRPRPTHRPGIKCGRHYSLFCSIMAGGAGRKRSDIDDIGQANDIGDTGERPDMPEDREKEREGGRGGGGRESDGFRGTIEGDYLRSDLNRQLSDERQLVDIGNHRRGHSARSAQLDSAIGRLRSLLGTTDLDVDDRGEAAEEGKREERQEDEEKREEEKQDTPERRVIDRDRNYVLNETQALLSKILSDIEGRLDQPSVPRSVSRK